MLRIAYLLGRRGRTGGVLLVVMLLLLSVGERSFPLLLTLLRGSLLLKLRRLSDVVLFSVTGRSLGSRARERRDRRKEKEVAREGQLPFLVDEPTSLPSFFSSFFSFLT